MRTPTCRTRITRIGTEARDASSHVGQGAVDGLGTIEIRVTG